MTQTVPGVTAFPIDATAALCDVAAFADRVVQTLRVARALITGGRVVCLEGLETQVAQLCARCLGLDRQDAANLRLCLLALRAELDATTLLLSAREEAYAHP